MKTIKVVAAVIRDGNRIFATQRGYGDFKGGWEFPGGKVNDGEYPKDALVREIREELDTEIVVGDLIETVEYDYPTFHLTMHCYICNICGGKLNLNAHNDAKWVSLKELSEQQWVPADIEVVKKLVDVTK